jgi:hypothetical protein
MSDPNIQHTGKRLLLRGYYPINDKFLPGDFVEFILISFHISEM